MQRLKVVIVGTGGHAQVIWSAWQALCQQNRGHTPDVMGWLETITYNGPDTLHGLPVYRETPELLAMMRAQGITAFLAGLGMVQASPVRHAILARLTEEQGLEPATLIHPTATVDAYATVEPGCYIGAGAIIQPFSRLGSYSIVNTGAIVEHHVQLGENVHIAPGSVLCGDVAVGAHTMIGAGSVVLQGITIGHQVTVGAGSTVTGDVPGELTVVGAPAKALKRPLGPDNNFS